MIQGGYITLARNIIESDVFYKPPLYLKVWLFLLCKAYYSPNGCEGNGEVCVTADEIREACSYQKGYRKVLPTRDQIYQILRYFKANSGEDVNCGTTSGTESPMIEITRTTHYMRIKILKFEKYQDWDEYSHAKQCEKNVDLKSDTNSGQSDEATHEAPHEQNTCSNSPDNSLQLNTINNIYRSNFASFWEAYPKKVGKPKAEAAFKKLQVDDAVLAKMLDAIERQKQSDQWQEPKFIPHPTTWLNQRRWEDEDGQPEGGGLTKTADGTFKF